MASEILKRGRTSHLDPKSREGFIEDVKAGLSDELLAVKYRISARTATNWRVRLLGKRPRKSPGALNSDQGNTSHTDAEPKDTASETAA